MEALQTIQQKLQAAKPALSERYHINSMGLFGSMVRNDYTDDSDIDIIVEFNQPVGIEFIDLANELENMFQRRVDLVSRAGIKPQYLQHIQPEIVYF
jgi:hypothetical protein